MSDVLSLTYVFALAEGLFAVIIMGLTRDMCAGDLVCMHATITAVAQDQSGWTTCSVRTTSRH